MKRPSVVVVGSSNTDMVVRVSSLPSAGETVLGEDLVVAAGGKGANQAVAAARLEADVTLVARLGTDFFGDQALANFAKDDLNTDFIVRDPDRPSGVALIMVGADGENVIAVSSGANASLCPEDVDRAHEVIRSSDVMLLQLEVPLETVRHAASLGQELGCRVILNPAPAQVLDRDLLAMVTTLTPNESEAFLLTGIEPIDPPSCSAAAAVLRELGVQEVIITLGEQGAFVADQDQDRIVSGVRVQAVDTTAAGDAFNGALACSLARGHSLLDAIEFANRVAALSVTRLGAQPSLPSLAELN